MGIDIGGTKTAVAIITATGKTRAKATIATPAAEGGQRVIAAALEAADTLLSSYGAPVAGCGLGVPGTVDSSGVVVSATALLPGWAGIQVAEAARDRLRLPVQVVNDVHAAALAELRHGAAAGASRALVVSVGTGIGGALILDGHLDPGPHGTAGSIGHIPVIPPGRSRRCSCGSWDHLEAHASGPAVAAAFADLVNSGGSGPHGDGQVVDLREVVALAARSTLGVGTLAAQAVLSQGGAALGRAIAAACILLDPEVVVLCGGVPHASEHFTTAARETARHDRFLATRYARMVVSRSGGDSGVIGAGLLGFEAGRRSSDPPFS